MVTVRIEAHYAVSPLLISYILHTLIMHKFLFIYTHLLKSSMFRASSSLSSGGISRNCIYAASGIATLCRFFVVKSFIFNIRVVIFSV